MTEYNNKWEKAKLTIKNELAAADRNGEFDTWFQPLMYESYDKAANKLLIKVPSATHCEKLDKHYMPLLAKVLIPFFGKGLCLNYRITVDKVNNKTVVEEQETELVNARANAARKRTALPDIDPQLDPRLNFKNFIEGDSNRLSRSIGIMVAEHPKNTKFNPMFVFGASGVGKTHLVNAIGIRAKELYPHLRVLYVSARIFQQQYTTAVQKNTVNDFIAFYQTLDILIVDDIQEWASSVATQNTFFHIFDYLFRQSKRIVLVSDRSPAQLRGMHERLITRFACGATLEVEKPNPQLCIDILKSKISREGLTETIPEDVVEYIADKAKGSVRDLQGVINSIMAYSVNDNSPIDLKFAEKVVRRIVSTSDEPVTLDFIMDTVCDRLNVSPQDINGKSRKKDIVRARQIVMYLSQRMTSLPALRVGRLIGGRDHSTVIHSCRKIEAERRADQALVDLIASLEKEIKSLKKQ